MFTEHYLPPQEEYVLNLTRESESIAGEDLCLRSISPCGEAFAFTPYYLTRNGRPTIPVMGEFHYSRFPHQYWKEELRKIRSGGVSIVATYLFWNHIEEEEGNFDWSDDRDIRSFVELCGSVDLEVILRCGPFVHGECRNGGLPDWLYGRAIGVRSMDALYLSYVRRFFGEIGKQVSGLLFKDGGPVIGLQLENEYMHAGAPWEVTYARNREFVPAGSDGSAHLRELRQLAIEAGLVVPIYSCTAWGGAPVPDTDFLPTQSGYAYTPWIADHLHEQLPTEEFLFRDRRAQPRVEGKVAYDTGRYPYVYSELGSGSQITYAHRSVVSPECVLAMAIVALGSGTNWLGYYMYHGGSNPVGKHSYLNENTVPRISYDFQAPLGEYGQVKPSYHYLRLLHLFLQEWGETLAPMSVTVPGNHLHMTPDDVQTVRYAVRGKDGSGFIFLNNYQDHVTMRDHDSVRLHLQLPAETLVIPRQGSLRLQKDISAILPFNLRLPLGVLLKYATAQPVTTLHADQQTICIFFAPGGMEAEFAFDRTTYQSIEVIEETCREEGHECDYFRVVPGLTGQIRITALGGKILQIFVLTQEQALTLWKVNSGDVEQMLLIDGALVTHQGRMDLYWQGKGEVHLAAYPTLSDDSARSADLQARASEGVFSHYALRVPECVVPLEILPIDRQTTRIRIPANALAGLHDAILRIDYLGDVGDLYLDGRLVGDNFANELPWEIGLKRFLTSDRDIELILHISPLPQDDPRQRYLRKKIGARTVTGGEDLLEIFSISAIPEYRAELTL